MNELPLREESGVNKNHTFDEIAVGDVAHLSRTLSQRDLDLLVIASGDQDATQTWGTALVSAVLSTKLPGAGTVVRSQDFRFLQQISVGDTLTAVVLARDKAAPEHTVTFDCRATNQRDEEVITATVVVLAPSTRIVGEALDPPEVHVGTHRRFHDLLARVEGMPPVMLAVAHPCDALSLAAAVEVAQRGMVVPILVGPVTKIRSIAREANIDISSYRLVDAAHSHDAAAKAVALIRAGEAEMLMKGSLHTDELMHAVVATETGLRTERRLSHVYIMDVPSYSRPLFITDAVVNIAPTLDDKRDIVQNAIDLTLALGLHPPRVAILCAVETVNSAMRSTLDAAALCKMADRGQITGGILDGPLAFDNAVSPMAARQKGIVSPVAGLADILVVPDLEAGNMLAKQLSFMAGADAAGVILGARVPIILTSRADSTRTRIASCAVAVLLAHAARKAGTPPHDEAQES